MNILHSLILLVCCFLWWQGSDRNIRRDDLIHSHHCLAVICKYLEVTASLSKTRPWKLLCGFPGLHHMPFFNPLPVHDPCTLHCSTSLYSMSTSQPPAWSGLEYSKSFSFHPVISVLVCAFSLSPPLLTHIFFLYEFKPIQHPQPCCPYYHTSLVPNHFILNQPSWHHILSHSIYSHQKPMPSVPVTLPGLLPIFALPIVTCLSKHSSMHPRPLLPSPTQWFTLNPSSICYHVSS